MELTVATKEGRAKNAIYLEHGKPMLFGENKEFGLMQEGFGLKVVKLGENGVTERYPYSRCTLPGQYASIETGVNGRP